MADLIDLASARIEAMQQRELQQFRQAQEQPPAHFDGTHCTDCDSQIPEGRRVLGCFRCVHCQTLREHHQKQHRR